MTEDESKFSAWREIFKRLFDPSEAQVALLNLDGVILQTNLAWQRFGRENGLPPTYECIGKNYLDVCDAAANADEPGAREAYIGLLEVLRTHRPKFTMVYPCHSPTERRWFRMWVEPQLPQIPAIVVAHYLRRTKPMSIDEGQFEVRMKHQTPRTHFIVDDNLRAALFQHPAMSRKTCFCGLPIIPLPI